MVEYVQLSITFYLEPSAQLQKSEIDFNWNQYQY